jgi:hypothetical protein
MYVALPVLVMYVALPVLVMYVAVASTGNFYNVAYVALPVLVTLTGILAAVTNTAETHCLPIVRPYTTVCPLFANRPAQYTRTKTLRLTFFVSQSQAFLTGTLQNFARKNGFAIDQVTWNFNVEDGRTEANTPDAPASGCYINGFFLEGARWCYENHALAESKPKELYTEFPLFWLEPVKVRIFSQSPRSTSAIAHTRTRRDGYLCPLP